MAKKTDIEQAKREAEEVLSKYKLDDTDRALLKYKMDFPGIEHKELGILVGINPTNISRRTGAKKWKAAWNELHLPARALLEQNADRLARKYLALAECGDPAIEEKVVKTLLISMGILKNKVDLGKGEGWEPLVLNLPLSGQQVVVTTREGQTDSNGRLVSAAQPSQVPPVRVLQPEDERRGPGDDGRVQADAPAGSDDARR